MDDVVLFGYGSLKEWDAYKDILDIFCSTLGMCISVEKSSFPYNNLQVAVNRTILPYKVEAISTGFKYLGFWLKPFVYGAKDWRWIVKSFENRISHWTYRLLSLGCRLIIIRSVLTGIPVY